MRLDLSAIEARAAESPLCGYGCRHVPALVAEVRRYRNGACEVCWNNAWVPTEDGSRCDYCWVERQLDHERTGRLQAEERVALAEGLRRAQWERAELAEARVAELEELCQSILEAPPAAQRGGLQFEWHHGTKLSDVLRSGAANHRARTESVEER